MEQHHPEPGAETQAALLARMQRLEKDIELIASSLQIPRSAPQHGARDLVPSRADRVDTGTHAFTESIFGHATHAARLERTTKAQRARRIIAERRRRERTLGSELFADPAWDMLLDLYAAYHERRNVSVSSLCIASAVPATTALRWIKTMTDKGLFMRSADAHDGRRIYLHIADHVLEAMDEFLARAEDLPPGTMPI